MGNLRSGPWYEDWRSRFSRSSKQAAVGLKRRAANANRSASPLQMHVGGRPGAEVGSAHQRELIEDFYREQEHPRHADRALQGSHRAFHQVLLSGPNDANQRTRNWAGQRFVFDRFRNKIRARQGRTRGSFLHRTLFAS